MGERAEMSWFADVLEAGRRNLAQEDLPAPIRSHLNDMYRLLGHLTRNGRFEPVLACVKCGEVADPDDHVCRVCCGAPDAVPIYEDDELPGVRCPTCED